MFGKCTIFFEDPFWVGIFERTADERYSVARYVFGAEPGAAEILAFAHSQFQDLVFCEPVARAPEQQKLESFKHRLHRVRRETSQKGPGTKAQKALKAEQERVGLKAKALQVIEKEQDEKRQYHSRQFHRRQKRRGR